MQLQAGEGMRVCALCMCMPVLSLHSAGGYLTPALGIVPACVCSLIPVYMFMSLAQTGHAVCGASPCCCDSPGDPRSP